MMKNMMTRILALLLCLCLLPLSALGDVYEDYGVQVNDGTPVTRSDLELMFHFYADGFPDDGAMHYADWEKLVDKISIRGQMDSQSFPSLESRVLFDGGMYLNEKLTVPFEYSAYGPLRFVRSPALNGSSLFFNMINFFEFMLKPYKYIYIPTQYAALALYPEAWIKMWDMYEKPISAALAGEQTRTVDYDTLYGMCDDLNLIALEDENNRVYFFLTSLMIDLGMEWTALEKLGCWELLLDHLDPQKQGMTITVSENAETWVIGGTTVFDKTVSAEQTVLRLYLPDPDGYEFSVECSIEDEKITADLLILTDGEEYYHLSGGVDGLPAQGALSAEGTVWADITGSVLYQEIAPIRAQYAWSRTAQTAPYGVAMDIDVLHAETEKPFLGVSYRADVEEVPHTELQVKYPDNWDDFFTLNEMLLKEHVSNFKRSVVLAAAPIALEVPAGVISDVIAFMEEYGLLGIFGIE